jgi:hypothetical protein
MDSHAGANAVTPDNHINCAFELSSIPPAWKKLAVGVEEASRWCGRSLLLFDHSN